MRKSRWIPPVIAGASLLLAAFLYSVYRGFTDVEQGENVSAVSWLPKTASNVSFYRSYPRTAYEFDMDEPNFLAWAEARNWRVVRIGTGSVSIPRYGFCQEPQPSAEWFQRGKPMTVGEEAELQARIAAYHAMAYQVIANGYHYEIRQRNGGGIQTGYDASRRRAYVYTTPR